MASAISLASAPLSAGAAERKLLMTSFRDLVVDANIDIELTIGGSPKAVLTGAKKDLERITLERRGNQMTVLMKPQFGLEFQKPLTEPLRLAISNYELENIEMRGSGNLKVNKLSSSANARILMTGSGDINLGSASARNLSVSIIGGGNLTIGSGKVMNGQFELQGSPTADLSGVSFTNLTIRQDGNAKSRADVQQAATIYSNGSGSITVTGKGSCFVREAGSTVIDCKKYAR